MKNSTMKVGAKIRISDTILNELTLSKNEIYKMTGFTVSEEDLLSFFLDHKLKKGDVLLAFKRHLDVCKSKLHKGSSNQGDINAGE